jgi:type I site-specific restriction endonuclease
MSQRPEDKAREAIDNMLAKSGWHVKDDKKIFKRTERLRQILLKVLLKEY